MRRLTIHGLVLLIAGSAVSLADSPRVPAAGCDNQALSNGRSDEVAAAALKFETQLSGTERAALDKPFGRDAAIRWSNLPIGIVPRQGLRLGDLDAAKARAAHDLLGLALSTCGLELLDEIRGADDQLVPLDSRKIGWGSGNYYMAIVGKPGRDPWILQVGGHHIAYNLMFNGRQAGATPLFFGTEPIRFTVDGKEHEPLRRQSGAMQQLSAAVSVHAQAKLSGTFTDVVKGVVVVEVPGKLPSGGIDTGFPQTYPSGDRDRGVRYTALTPAQQKLVRQAIESYTALPGQAIARPLLAAYESPAALSDTFVGYAGTTDFSAKGSYVRIDGPRIWMEFIVQPAVARPADLHYHALWRDKQADYGGEIGGQ